MAQVVPGAEQTRTISRLDRTANDVSSSDSMVNPTMQSAVNLFSLIRQNPECLGVLWNCGPKANKEICKKIILQNIFPEHGGESLEVQFALLLRALFQAEVAGSSDLNRLLREDSLACVLSAAYGRRKRGESFARGILESIFADSLRDPSIRLGSTSESYDPALLDATFKSAVAAICSRIDDFPVGFAFASYAIVNALKMHPRNEVGVSLSATSAVGSILFLRYIVPFVVQYGQGRQPAAQTFFGDLGNVLQKACNGSKFGPNHKHEFLNPTIGELSVNIGEALSQLSSKTHSAPAQQFTGFSEPSCEFDAAELQVFVSLLSSAVESSKVPPSTISDFAFVQALFQLQHQLAKHSAEHSPSQAPSVPSSSAKEAAVSAPVKKPSNDSPHIMDGSSFTSRFTFWWCNHLFKLGYSKTLSPDDLWPAPSRTLCSSSLLQFETAWNSQSTDLSKVQKPGMRVFKAAWKCFGHLFLTSIFLQTVWVATALSLPSYFLRQLISFANNPDEPLQNGILYAVFMFVAQLTSVTCLHNQVLRAMRRVLSYV